MSLSREDVAKVALLARLQFSDAELVQMTEELSAIVDYVELLSELDTQAVEPLAHPLDVSNCFAADEPRPSLSHEDALANAPKSDGEYFLVPAVL